MITPRARAGFNWPEIAKKNLNQFCIGTMDVLIEHVTYNKEYSLLHQDIIVTTQENRNIRIIIYTRIRFLEYVFYDCTS